MLALVATGAGLPGIGGSDRRHPVSPAAMPWAALARLQVPGSSRCTAFVVDAHTAVSAAHCLYSVRLGHLVPAGSVHLLVGYDRGSFAVHAVAASYVVAPGHQPGAGGAASDLAVLRFAAPVAPAGQTLPLWDGEPAAALPLVLAGYGQDRAEALLADTACALQGRAGPGQDAMLVHDCEGTHGTSGAPILAQDALGTWRVVGVQVTAREGGAGGMAVPTSAVRRLLGR